MTFEERIDKMITSMDALTAALTNITVAAAAMPETPKVETPKTKPPKAETQETETKDPEAITQDQLQDICLALVRKDRSMKTKISALIKKHGGELLKDIDPAKYPTIKTELEALNAD